MTNEKRNAYERLSRFIRKNHLLTSGNETSVWEFIFNGAFGKNGYNKDAQFIADKLGMGKRTVERAVSKMKSTGLIAVKRYKGASGKFGNNTFIVLDPTAKNIKTNRQKQETKMAVGETTQTPDTEGVKTMKEDQICTFSQTANQPPKMAGQSKEPTLTGNYIGPEDNTNNWGPEVNVPVCARSRRLNYSETMKAVADAQAAVDEQQSVIGKLSRSGLNRYVDEVRNEMNYCISLIRGNKDQRITEDFHSLAIRRLNRFRSRPEYGMVSPDQKSMIDGYEETIGKFMDGKRHYFEVIEQAQAEEEDEPLFNGDNTDELVAEYNGMLHEDSREITQQDIADAMDIVLDKYRASIATGDGITSTELIDKFKALFYGYHGADAAEYADAFNRLSESRRGKIQDKEQVIAKPKSAFHDPDWKPTFDYGRFNDKTGTKKASPASPEAHQRTNAPSDDKLSTGQN